MPQCAATRVCVDEHLVQVEELVQDVHRVIHRFAVDWWDCGVFETLDKLIDRDGHHGRGWGG